MACLCGMATTAHILSTLPIPSAASPSRSFLGSLPASNSSTSSMKKMAQPSSLCWTPGKRTAVPPLPHFFLHPSSPSPSSPLVSFLPHRRHSLFPSSPASSPSSAPSPRLPPLMALPAFVDPWAPLVNSESIASSLFAASLFPYMGFLFHLTRSKTSPPLTLFGFYFLLAFVAATIPAGIYAKVKYGTSLSNVDYLHGGAESLLTITNLFIVFGLRRALREEEKEAEEEELAQTVEAEQELK